MKLLIILALFLVITLLQVYDAEGKTLWGARKKKENEDRSNSKSNKPKIDDILQQRQGRSRNSRISRNNEKAEVNSQVKELFDTYLVKLEELIDSEDLATLVDPNMIKPLLDQIALFSPESKSMFDEIHWDDLDLNAYRDSLKESVRLIKDNSEQIFQILNDPNAMEQYTSMLPEEVKDIFSALQRGEVDSLADLVSKIPGR